MQYITIKLFYSSFEFTASLTPGNVDLNSFIRSGEHGAPPVMATLMSLSRWSGGSFSKTDITSTNNVGVPKKNVHLCLVSILVRFILIYRKLTEQFFGARWKGVKIFKTFFKKKSCSFNSFRFEKETLRLG